LIVIDVSALEAMANIAEADKYRIANPRKAMSLYLKAGKGEEK